MHDIFAKLYYERECNTYEREHAHTEEITRKLNLMKQHIIVASKDSV